jgi:GR25 family glycosyltransferase involved in LPS biosynthesis
MFDTVVNNSTTMILNLYRRPDRWDAINRQVIADLKPSRFPAVDGVILDQSQLPIWRIFDRNSFGWKRCPIGCGLSTLLMWIQFLQTPNVDYAFIFEDDITFEDDFMSRLKTVLDVEMPVKSSMIDEKSGWDLIYLGHHYWEKKLYSLPHKYAKQMKTVESRSVSMGGTFGYLLSRRGAEKFIKFVSMYGIQGTVDMTMMNFSNFMNVYYIHPHLVLSDCYRPSDKNTTIDTDIQFDFQSMDNDIDNRLVYELGLLFKTFNHIVGVGYTFNDINEPSRIERVARCVCTIHTKEYITLYDNHAVNLEKYIIIVNIDNDTHDIVHLTKMSRQYIIVLYSTKQHSGDFYYYACNDSSYKSPFMFYKKCFMYSKTYTIDKVALVSIPTKLVTPQISDKLLINILPSNLELKLLFVDK